MKYKLDQTVIPCLQEALIPQPASQRVLESKTMVALGSGEGAPPDPLVRLDQNYRMSVGEKEKNSIVKATLAKAGEVKGKRGNHCCCHCQVESFLVGFVTRSVSL